MIVQVPATPPQTREEWAIQNAIWPTAWRQPETTAFRASMQAPEIDDGSFQAMCSYMDKAFALAGQQGACNAAVIVDPVQGEMSYDLMNEHWRCKRFDAQLVACTGVIFADPQPHDWISLPGAWVMLRQ